MTLPCDWQCWRRNNHRHLKKATIFGTRMAGLNGATYSHKMPNAGIGFSIPVEKLFHVNGTP